MKKKYIEPELEIMETIIPDIVMASGDNEEDDVEGEINVFE